MSQTTDGTPFWRVDESNTVFITVDSQEVRVGQYPDGTTEDALNYFRRKGDEFVQHVQLLEARIARGTAGAESVSAIESLKQQLEHPQFVVDVADVRERLSSMAEKLAAVTEREREQRREARGQAMIKLEQLVERIEALAAREPAKIIWKQASADVNALFEEWKSVQATLGSHSRSQRDALWKRFKAARNTLERERRAFFATADTNAQQATQEKERLIRAAEALAPKGADGVVAYRGLLEQWKRAGHARRKTDEELWQRFKAAGDVLYAAKSEVDALLNAEHEENLSKKLALLDSAEGLLTETQYERARQQLAIVSQQWDAIGHVPRNQQKTVEARMRALEAHVRKLHDAEWNATDPEKVARSAGLRGQIEASLTALSEQLDQARQQGDSARENEIQQAIETQTQWLATLAQ